MTLKEKFENVLHNWIDKDYDRQHVARVLEIDADEFAIGFSEWCASKYVKLHNCWVGHYTDQRNKDNWKKTPELLEIYKKEKGL